MFCGFGALNDASLDSSSFISNQSLDQGSSKGQQVKLAGGGQLVSSGGQSDVNQNEGEKDGRLGPDGGPGLGTTSKEIDQHRAIQFQKSAFNAQVENRLDDAISNYKKLLETDFVSQISPDHPGYKMRYAALKNLTRILPKSENNDAIYYLKEAIKLDSTEVSFDWPVLCSDWIIGLCSAHSGGDSGNERSKLEII